MTPTPISHQTSKGATTRTGKNRKGSCLRRLVRRKNCIYCFVFNIIFFLACVGAIITISFRFVSVKGYIRDQYDRNAKLKARSDFGAFFHSVCPIYPKNARDIVPFNHTFCNRYCEGNRHMEFLYRFINMTGTTMTGSGQICPHYVDIRPCQDKRLSPQEGYTCERKKFTRDYVFKDVNHMGICVACTSNPSSGSPTPASEEPETQDASADPTEE